MAHYVGEFPIDEVGAPLRAYAEPIRLPGDEVHQSLLHLRGYIGHVEITNTGYTYAAIVIPAGVGPHHAITTISPLVYIPLPIYQKVVPNISPTQSDGMVVVDRPHRSRRVGSEVVSSGMVDDELLRVLVLRF